MPVTASRSLSRRDGTGNIAAEVPPRDAQMILGHAHISTTVQIYTHVDDEAREEALAGLGKLLVGQ